MTVAALFVMEDGPYADLPDVEVWGPSRDARLYPGPHPVVAHPPCARWSVLAGLVEFLGGKKRGEDDGCFKAALNAVRKWGGVLEHPAHSAAWSHFGLLRPQAGGGWSRGLFDEGCVCEVSQAAYGHRARKLTWLYAVTKKPPRLDWSRPEVGFRISEARHRGGGMVQRMGHRERSETPEAFRDVLLDLARSVEGSRGGWKKTEVK